MASGENDGADCKNLRSSVSAAARVRNEGEDFSSSFTELKLRVRAACQGQKGWEAGVVAGIQAIVEFAAAKPAKALALTVEARRPRADQLPPAGEVLAYFTERLSELAPSESRSPISTDRSVVEAIAMVVRGHLIAGTAEQLPDVAPDLVYLALMPYLGLTETRGWSNALEVR